MAPSNVIESKAIDDDAIWPVTLPDLFRSSGPSIKVEAGLSAQVSYAISSCGGQREA